MINSILEKLVGPYFQEELHLSSAKLLLIF